MEKEITRSSTEEAMDMLERSICLKLRLFEELFLDYANAGGAKLTGIIR